MIKTVELSEITPDLLDFIEKCTKLEYKNNNSIKAMKFDWALESGGTWYVTYDGNSIVGISGVHKFKDGYRVLFRGAQLYSIPGGLTKNHMNCWMWYYHLPLAIEKYGDKPLYITTNTENDASGKMLRLNRLYHILEKKGFVTLEGTEKVFNAMQNVWKLNPERYFELRPEIK